MTQLNAADIYWDDNNIPRSTQFDDLYFCTQDGLAESQYVFLQGNQLAQRFASLAEGEQFVICETGFGTGLNFIAVLQLWQQVAPKTAFLYYYSAEKFPLNQHDLEKAHQHFPQLSEFSDPLITRYPSLVTGFNTLDFDHGVRLTLMFDDAAHSFSQMQAKVDAWILDGFAPSKNPAMWSDQLFDQINRLSHFETTAATFTAARLVKDGLCNAGFQVKKPKGFGKKRNMITASFTGRTQPPYPFSNKAWFELNHTKSEDKPNSVLVIGAGIAGATTAHALSNQGCKVTVVDQADDIAQGASGNRQGIFYFKPTLKTSAPSQFAQLAFNYAHQFYQNISDHIDMDLCGLQQVPHNPKTQKVIEGIQQDSIYPTDLVDISNSDPSLSLPKSGWLHPKSVIDYLLKGIEVNLNTQVNSLKFEQNQWFLNHHEQGYDAVVICAGWLSETVFEHSSIQINQVRGQVSSLPERYLKQSVKEVLCCDGYISPSVKGQINFGASFDPTNLDNGITEQDHIDNVTRLNNSFEDLITMPKNSDEFGGRVSIRASSKDHLPLLGQLVDEATFRQSFKKLKDTTKLKRQPAPLYLQGLFINTGHGSRGLTSAPLSAQILTDLICQRPLSIGKDLFDHLNVNRFLVKDMQRGR